VTGKAVTDEFSIFCSL